MRTPSARSPTTAHTLARNWADRPARATRSYIQQPKPALVADLKEAVKHCVAELEKLKARSHAQLCAPLRKLTLTLCPSACWLRDGAVLQRVSGRPGAGG